MRYKSLGNSGLRVSELCLGTMTFGDEWGWGASKEESRKTYDAFLEAGGNFVDTANLYTDRTGCCGPYLAPTTTGSGLITGARRASQIKDNIASVEFTLDKGHLERLNDASHIELGFPHDFYQLDLVCQFAYGGMRDLIDNHH